jgi:hypothetical protein
VEWACFSDPRRCGAVRGAGAPATADTADSPTGFAAVIVGSNVTLMWNAPAGGAVVSYVIEAGTAPGLSNITTFDTNNAATSLTVIGVPAGTYHARVRRRNADGLSGPSSDVVVMVGGAGPCTGTPAAPTGLTGSANATTASLAWNSVNGAAAFIIEAGSMPGASDLAVIDTGSAATSFVGAAPAGTYYVRIRVRTVCGTSAVSNEVIVTVGAGAPGPSVAGEWTGLRPDGLIAITGSPCSDAIDLFLSIAQTGTAISGTATFRLRETRCNEPFETVTVPLLNGSASNGRVTFEVEGDESRMSFSGSVSGNRMSGTTIVRDLSGRRADGRASWAVSR